MQNQYYDWTRYWLPVDKDVEEVERSRKLRLYSPNYSFDEERFKVGFRKLNELDDIHCVILFGEPGSGKTTCINKEMERLQNQNNIFKYDLKDYSSDLMMMDEVFKSNINKIKNLIAANTDIYFYLDSFDECSLNFSTVGERIIKGIELFKPHLNKIFLRVLCRTAVWPSRLSARLSTLWKNEQILSEFKLAPLQSADIDITLKENNIDSDKFWEDLHDNKAENFAKLPLTLIPLIENYRKNGKIHSSPLELWNDLILKLCSENNSSRQEKYKLGCFSPEQRRKLAEWIAAITIFCEKNAIVLGSGNAKKKDMGNAVDINDFLEISDEKQSYEDKQKALKEVLDSALFTLVGENQFKWAHRTYAEFLAASFLKRHDLSIPQIRSLLCQTSEKVTPRLEVVAGWLGALSDLWFGEISKDSPEVLIETSLYNKNSDQKSKFLIKWLESVERKDVTLPWMGYNYKGLYYDTLDDDCRTKLGDKTLSAETRRIVLKILEDCDLASNVIDDISKISMDAEEYIYLRSSCVRVISKFGDDETRKKMVPFAIGVEEDIEDDLKGNALHCIWPSIASIEDILSMLTPYRKSNYIGSYASFLRHYFSSKCQENDCIKVLDWLKGHNTNLFTFTYDLQEIILIRCIDLLDSSSVVDALADFILFKAQKDDWYDFVRTTDFHKKLLQSAKRLDVLINLLHKLPNDVNLIYKITNFRNLISPSDVDVLISEIDKHSNSERKLVLAWIVEYFIRQYNKHQYLEKVISICEKHNECKSIFDAILKPLVLDSEEAKQIKKDHYMYIQNSNPAQEEHSFNAQLSDIEQILREIEDGNLNSWQNLVMQLRRNTWASYDVNLYELEIWKQLSFDIKRRIVYAGLKYLSEYQSKDVRWFEGRHIAFEIELAFLAFTSLYNENIELFENIDIDVWKKWSAVFLILPCLNTTEEKETHEPFIRAAYKNAPNELLESLSNLLDNRCKEEDPYCGNIEEHVEAVWDYKFARVFLTKARNQLNQTVNRASILGACLKHRDELAKSYAIDNIKNVDLRNIEQRKLAIAFSKVLLWHYPTEAWDIIFNEIIKKDVEAGKILFEQIGNEIDYKMRNSIEVFSESQLTDLYIFLRKAFPIHEDIKIDGAHFASPREMIATFRDRLPGELIDKGTFESLKAVETIIDAFPYMVWMRPKARANYLNKAWSPIAYNELIKITENKNSRVVQRELQLLELVCESLKRMQDKIYCSSKVLDFWEDPKKGKFKEKTEATISRKIYEWLEEDLINNKIIVNREAIIYIADRTDVKIEARNQNTDECFTVIIECKGCWNVELDTALGSQLIGQYLRNSDCKHGIYLIGYFHCEQWCKQGSHKHKNDLQEMKDEFEKQAKQKSGDEYEIRAFILDVSIKNKQRKTRIKKRVKNKKKQTVNTTLAK